MPGAGFGAAPLVNGHNELLIKSLMEESPNLPCERCKLKGIEVCVGNRRLLKINDNLKYVSRLPRGGRYKTVSKIGNLIW